ncbi:MAG: hypothetical protein AAF675_15200 [Pseudomonadota bacterium]
MSARYTVPPQPIQGDVQFAELLLALQTPEALQIGLLIAAVGLFLFLREIVGRSHDRIAPRQHRDERRRSEISACRAARSRRVAQTTLDY